MNRRRVIGAVAAALAFALVPKGHRARAKLRPPGAQPPGLFEAACIGCFRCAEVCPTRVIVFSDRTPLDSATPELVFEDRACVLCLRCTEVCPTGALATRPASVRIGAPKLNAKACLSWSGRGVCRLCHQVCPYPDAAVSLVGPSRSPVFHAEACVGCGLCQEACPDVARAIVIEPLA